MIELVGVSKAFTQGRTPVPALREVSLSVDQGEFYVLLGASGCGKTTTLRIVAGLERPDSGSVRIDGRQVFGRSPDVWVGPEERPQAMVFQSYALWPHMTIRQNIAFPLRRGVRRPSGPEAAARVEEALGLFRLTEQADRKVTQLSGGQQQRVALARALALHPRVLLMDEPLSNLDARLRMDLRLELKELARRKGITCLLVTHDQEEAMMLADRVGIVHDGAIVQEGTPAELYGAPKSEFVATFLDHMNLIRSAEVTSCDASSGPEVTARGVRLRLGPGDHPLGGELTLGIRPGDIVVLDADDESPSAPNLLSGRLVDHHYLGGQYLYRFETPLGRLNVRSAVTPQRFAQGTVRLRLPAQKLISMAAGGTP
ncbi:MULTISPECIES: ABC transporter ATP-binding protein [unclassified Streptomyces]|uniref:ABC transporter ATP-binding protein n=1 Tax=unclassified Streptomyces TaxID=2593676 RepID=UPI00136A53B0|nr:MULTISPECIES: ABC transporter ATP-binding protein [unclassified Streptomyces]MCW5251328.1 ABC transporter ATP-binding protein [Streptomyces sp. SHP 1-2]MYU22614.1 ATP-binding cassette domain-containing protein [Streptomyces sp. SID8352]